MIEQDYILLIMNCKKYLKKAKFQKMTWLKQIPSYLKYYHVIGDPSLHAKYQFDDVNQILWIQVEDDYNSLPKKVIRAYEAVSETYHFKYLCKTDDDQVLTNVAFFDKIKEITSASAPKIHYGGYIVDVKHDHLSKYHMIHPELPPNLPLYKTKYCSGRFYFLSRQAILYLLVSKKKKIEDEFFEDYAIGYHLDPLYKHHMIHLPTNQYFTDIEWSDFPVWVEKGLL
jgi:hypothetical protein